MTENYQDDTLRIFSLNANRPLAEKIAASVGTELGKSTVRQFSDGEIQINIEESIRGDHVYIIQATNAPVNDHLMELLILIDALKRASAKTINVILPYYGYARQDRTAKPREPITAKLVANMLVEAGATRLLTLDLHTVQVQGFFDIPVDNLFTMPLFAHYYRQQALVGEEIVIVSPKNSGVQRARSLSEYLDATLAIVDHEEIDGVRQEGYVIGNVAGKKCILVDDILNTGQTLATAAEVLMKNGAQEVYVGREVVELNGRIDDFTSCGSSRLHSESLFTRRHLATVAPLGDGDRTLFHRIERRSGIDDCFFDCDESSRQCSR